MEKALETKVIQGKDTLVFAGSYQQYVDWITNNKVDRTRYRFVSLPEHLAGFHNIEYITVGQYYLNKAYCSALENNRLSKIII